MKSLILVFCFIGLPVSLGAQNEPDPLPELDAVPPPPDIPDALESGQPIEPEVTIIRSEESITEEYRINGKLYMVKVTPTVGVPYYLIDNDGDGLMESRINKLGNETIVPKWVLFSW